MKRTVLLHILLALALVLGTMGGTGAIADEQEPVELDFMYIGAWDTVETYESPLFAEIERNTGVRMTCQTITGDKQQVVLAGGDTTDVLMIYDQTSLLPAIEGGLMMPLNDLIDEHAPTIKSTYPDRLFMSREILGDGSGNMYFLPVQCGSEGFPASPYHSIYMVRWDLYKQMGYPEVTDEDSFLAMLAEMLKLEPATPDGRPVYGVSGTFASLREIGNIYNYTYGYYSSNAFIATNINTGEMVYEPLDADSPFWRGAEYYNKAYKLGLLDPDAFTQKGDDRNAKITAGQVLAPVFDGFIHDFEAKALAEDPNTIKGFQTLPVEGTTYWCNSYYKGGWDACFVGIPVTCKDRAAAIRVLDYLSTEDGARLVTSGVEGAHWNYIDGVPTYTDEFLDEMMGATDAYKNLYLGSSIFGSITGPGSGELHSDGYPINLRKSEQVYRLTNKPTDLDFCEYYGGAAFPMEVFLRKMEEGTIHDHINDVFDMRVVTGLGSAPEDIARIDAKILDTLTGMIPELIMADDFASAKAEAIDKLWASGGEEARSWWQARHDELTALFNPA